MLNARLAAVVECRFFGGYDDQETGRLLGMLSVGQSSLHSWLFVRVYQPLFGNYNGSLAFAVSFLLLSYLLMHWCYKRGYLLKV